MFNNGYGMVKPLSVQWTVPTTSKFTNTMSTLIANPYRWNWYDAIIMKNLVPLQDFNVYVKCHLMMVIFVTPEQIKDEFQRTRFNWLSMFTKISTWLTIVSVCHTVWSLKIPQIFWQWRNVGKCSKACWNQQPWMTWNPWLLRQKVKRFYGPKHIQVKTTPLVMKEHFLQLIGLLLQNVFDLKYIGSWWRRTPSKLWPPWGYSQWNALQLFLLVENYKGAFPTWLAPQQVTVIPVSNEAHTDYAWEAQLCDRGIRAGSGWNVTENAIQDLCVSNTKTPYQLIVGDKEMEEAEPADCSSYVMDKTNTCIKLCQNFL